MNCQVCTMSERVSPRGDAGEEGGRDDDALAPVGDPDPQVSHPEHSYLH